MLSLLLYRVRWGCAGMGEMESTDRQCVRSNEHNDFIMSQFRLCPCCCLVNQDSPTTFIPTLSLWPTQPGLSWFVGTPIPPVSWPISLIKMQTYPPTWLTDNGENINWTGRLKKNAWNHTVCYESIKRELKARPIYECRCDERLKTKAEESTRLPYTGLLGEVEPLKTKTRSIDELFASVMGKYVFLKW